MENHFATLLIQGVDHLLMVRKDMRATYEDLFVVLTVVDSVSLWRSSLIGVDEYLGQLSEPTCWRDLELCRLQILKETIIVSISCVHLQRYASSPVMKWPSVALFPWLSLY